LTALRQLSNFSGVTTLIAAQVDGERIGRMRLRRVKDASGASLEPAVQETVEPGSIVRTDGWGGYNNLDHLGYVREIVRKNAEVGDNLLPRCNRVAARLQRWLLGPHQGAVSHAHLDDYLDEYTFRFNRRTSRYRGKLFYRLLQQAVAIKPVPYTALVRHVRGPKPKNYKIRAFAYGLFFYHI
jgi:transposase-like protein